MTDLLDRRLVPSGEAMESRVGDETVLLHLGSGTYFGLDPVGTVIWAGLREGRSPREVRDHVCAVYGVDPGQAEADLRRFLEELLRHALVQDA